MSLARRLFDDAFAEHILTQVEDHPDTGRWSTAAKGKRKDTPNGEDAGWWRSRGPDMVQAWVDWRAHTGWRVWTTPDGQPAIELKLDWQSMDGQPQKAIVDRVMADPASGQLVIVDLKSGARSPESDLQLGYYRYGIYEVHGIDIRQGAYWMARTGQLSEVYDLTRFTPDLIETWMSRFTWARDNGVFLPNITFRCKACPMREYCVAYGGSRSIVDPDHPNYGGSD